MRGLKQRVLAAALAMALSASLAQPAMAWATDDVTCSELASEDLAPGVHYTEEDLDVYKRQGEGESKGGTQSLTFNHLEVMHHV